MGLTVKKTFKNNSSLIMSDNGVQIDNMLLTHEEMRFIMIEYRSYKDQLVDNMILEDTKKLHKAIGIS